jgi:AAA15 family ATPase/GTPase
MLTHLKLENFKSWRELDLNLANITVLFGANSSGKSNVLKSLLLLKQTVESHDRNITLNLGGMPIEVDFGSFNSIIFNEQDSYFGITFSWKTDNYDPFSEDFIEIMPPKVDKGFSTVSAINIRNISYSAQWEAVDSNSILMRKIHFDAWDNKNQNIFIHIDKEKEYYHVKVSDLIQNSFKLKKFTIFSVPQSYELPLYIETMNSKLHVSRGFNNEMRRFFEKIYYLAPIRSNPLRNYQWRGVAPNTIGRSGENTIGILLASERNQDDALENVGYWLEKMDLISEFRIKAIDLQQKYYETQIRIGANPAWQSLPDVGFGISQVLPIITLMFHAPEGSIILLEQPELHLHPGAQAHLADLFLHVAETRNLQLIIESHSEHLLRRLQRRIAEEEHEFATPNTIKAYFCEMTADGSKLIDVEVDKYGQVRNWPENFFGDISGELEAMTDAAIARRRKELAADND